MIVIGVDAHKRTHICAAVTELTGRQLARRTVSARETGLGDMLAWARELGDARVWAIEDCRHVTGRLERFLIARGERVVRVASKLTGAARRGVREPGKSDEIDALAIARVTIREGVDALPAAYLDSVALEIRRLSDHRERLVGQRTALINDLRWPLHDLDPSFEVPARSLKLACWQRRTAQLLDTMPASVQVRIARDEVQRIQELTLAINTLQAELADRVGAYRPGLLALPGCGVLTAAKAIGETAGAQRFATVAKFARITGTAPIPTSSGKRVRYRLDPGGNRQLNASLHRIAVTQLRIHPPARVYLDKKLAEGKTRREALRCLKRQLARTLWHLLLPDQPAAPPPPPPRRRATPHAIHCNLPMPPG